MICQFIYTRKYKRHQKGDTCNKTAVDAEYAKEIVNGIERQYCRAHAQNKKSYQQVKSQKQTILRLSIQTAPRLIEKRVIQTTKTKQNIQKSTSRSSIVGNDLPYDEEKEIRMNERTLVGHWAMNTNISQSTVENIAKDLKDVELFENRFSRPTISRAGVELSILADMVVADILPDTKDIFIGVDESSKKKGRSFIEIEIGGRYQRKEVNKTDHWYFKDESVPKEWSTVLMFVECSNHTSQTMLKLIQQSVERINTLQDVMGKKDKFNISQIKSLSADLTNSNFGSENGLSVLLEGERKKIDPLCKIPKKPVFVKFYLFFLQK